MSRKGNLASRSLEYRAPETPAFLKALQAQVSTSRYTSNSHRDELDDLVTSSSTSGRRKADQPGEEEEGLDSDDEINGAQVVVLKEGKHVSRDEAVRLKQQQQETRKEKLQNIAGSAGGATKKRRLPIDAEEKGSTRTDSKDKANPLDDVKQLIQKQRNPPSSPSTKEKPAKQKPKKAKPGKGLSFNFDDE